MLTPDRGNEIVLDGWGDNNDNSNQPTVTQLKFGSPAGGGSGGDHVEPAVAVLHKMSIAWTGAGNGNGAGMVDSGSGAGIARNDRGHAWSTRSSAGPPGTRRDVPNKNGAKSRSEIICMRSRPWDVVRKRRRGRRKSKTRKKKASKVRTLNVNVAADARADKVEAALTVDAVGGGGGETVAAAVEKQQTRED